MKIYKQDVINLTQKYISELINYNEEVNIRMSVSYTHLTLPTT